MKKAMLRKLAAMAIACAMAASLFACGQKPQAEETTAAAQTTAQTAAAGGTEAAQEETGETQAAEPFSYPMDPITFTINGADYYETSYYTQQMDVDPNDWCYSKLREATGVTLESFGCTSYGPTSSSFVMMLMSGELPDLYHCSWKNYPGGIQAAVNDGYIIPLNDYMDEYMPNFKAYLDANPYVKALVSLPDGTIAEVPMVWALETDRAYSASKIPIRKDWLDAQGLEIPETIEELDHVLRVLKEAYDLPAPLTFESRWLWNLNSACLSSAYGTTYTFYANDGVVHFGPLDPAYKDFIAQMATWYKDGILDPDFPTVSKSDTTGKFTIGWTACGLNIDYDSAILANKGEDNGFEVATFDGTVAHKGDKVELSGLADGVDGAASISPTCKNIEAACRFLDYGFSEEGARLLSYGTEGVSYEIGEDGKPYFTDKVKHPSNNASPGTARDFYTRYAGWAFLCYDIHAHNPDFTLDNTPDTNMQEHLVPNLNMTKEESDVIKTYWTNLDDYCRENIMSFIVGNTSMDEWDGFVQQIRDSYHAEEVLAAWQGAYDRYMALVD